MDQQREPLAWRLREAALERADEADRVDEVVLDEDGVIDLRAHAAERARENMSVADPAPILSTMRGKFGDAAEISDLYDTSEPDSPRWRLGLRARHAFGDQVPGAQPSATPPSSPAPAAPADTPRADTPPPRKPLSRISALPLSHEVDDPTPVGAEPNDAPTTQPSMADAIDPEVDGDGEARPTADCPQCAGLGRRDLFDRFSQVEFYSCDHCHHMWQQEFSG